MEWEGKMIEATIARPGIDTARKLAPRSGQLKCSAFQRRDIVTLSGHFSAQERNVSVNWRSFFLFSTVSQYPTCTLLSGCKKFNTGNGKCAKLAIQALSGPVQPIIPFPVLNLSQPLGIVSTEPRRCHPRHGRRRSDKRRI